MNLINAKTEETRNKRIAKAPEQTAEEKIFISNHKCTICETRWRQEDLSPCE